MLVRKVLVVSFYVKFINIINLICIIVSRIGKLPVNISSGVTITLEGQNIAVKGPKGELALTLHPRAVVNIEDNQIVVTRRSDSKEDRSIHGLTRTLIANLVEGVTKGYEKRLEIVGVGYRAQATGKKITLTLGFSHPVEMDAPAGIEVTMDEKEKNTIIIRGIDKQAVGEFAANVRKKRPPEPYKGKGIKYAGETILRKAGKSSSK